MGQKERLIAFCNSLNISKSEFERKANLANGYISKLKGRIGEDKLNGILNAFPQLSNIWLLTGEGEMLNGNVRQYSNTYGVWSRIHDFLFQKGLSFAKAESIMEWDNGKIASNGNMTLMDLEKFLLRFPELSAEWLLRGCGEMMRSPPSNPKGYEDFESLKEELNMLKGENNVLREQLGLPKKEGKVQSA